MAIQIFSDSSTDLPVEERKQYNIHYFKMSITVNGEIKGADIDYVEYSPEQLYEWIKDPNIKTKTAQVGVNEYVDKMRPFVSQGDTILYLACTTKLSGSLNAFSIAKGILLEEYPNAMIVGIDSTKSNMCLGLMAMDVARLRNEGKSLPELLDYIEKNKQHYHMVGSVETLSYLKAAGRISGASAFFGNLIGIKPMIMVDVHGYNYVYDKVRGTKKSLIESFEYLKKHMVEGVTDVVYVGQASAFEQQKYLCDRIENELHIKTVPFWIGAIVGISCGPGMYGLFFKGDEGIVDSEKLA